MIDREDSLDNIAMATKKTPRSARRYVNPFVMPEGSDRFGYREEENEQQRRELEKVHQMSLIQRTDRMQPSIPSLVNRTIRPQEPKTSKSNQNAPREIKPIQPESPNVVKSMRMTEFVAEKREIFLIQLIIDRKNKEVQRLNNQIKSEEDQLQETEMKIVEASNEYKMSSAQIEASLARARKSSETATKKRVELQKELRCQQQTVSLIRSDIMKNEDLLENYKQCKEFLESVKPDYANFDDYFKGPEVLLKHFDDMEQENLFLLDQYQNRQDEIEKDQKKYEKDLVESSEMLTQVSKKVETIPQAEIEDLQLSPGNVQQSIQIDKETARLTELIKKTFLHCFGKPSTDTPISMLELIEKAMDDLYERIQYVKPSFRNEKMTIKDKQRHLQELREESDRKEAQQHEKMMKAYERAKQPIKKKSGRPVPRRMLPNMFIKKDEEAERRRAEERQRIDNLLYGPDLD